MDLLGPDHLFIGNHQVLGFFRIVETPLKSLESGDVSHPGPQYHKFLGSLAHTP
jgi:hypothetical protein